MSGRDYNLYSYIPGEGKVPPRQASIQERQCVQPPQPAPNRQIPAFTYTETESKLISAEVGELLNKQAISRTVSDDGFISNIFLVPKRKRQMEADPQPQSSKCLHRTPALQNGRYLLCKGPPEQGGAILDLKDAYLSIPITQSHRKYLKFAWQGTVYQ